MKNKHNKRGLSGLLSTFNLECGVSVESRDDEGFLNDEPDSTIISYLFQAADASRQNSQRRQRHFRAAGRVAVQMENWDGVVLDINATCANLGDRVCSQLFGTHALSCCDTVSYPFGKGKASVLKTLKSRQLSRAVRRAG